MRAFESGVDRGFERLSDRVGGSGPPSRVRAYQNPGTYTFTAPTSGSVIVWCWAGGGGSNSIGSAGSAGGFSRKSFNLAAGDRLTLEVGRGGDAPFGLAPGASAVSLNGVQQILCSPGANNASYGSPGGSAIGGDVNVPGGAPSGSSASQGPRTGGLAGGDAYFSGGRPGTYQNAADRISIDGKQPGSGGVFGSGNDTAALGSGGTGMIVVSYSDEAPL